MIQHRIAEVRYHHGTNGDDAPLTCFCGWYGKAGEFADHRRIMGARRNEGSAAMGPELGTTRTWRLHRDPRVP